MSEKEEYFKKTSAEFKEKKISLEDYSLIMDSFVTKDIWLGISTLGIIPNGEKFSKFVSEVYEKAMKDFSEN